MRRPARFGAWQDEADAQRQRGLGTRVARHWVCGRKRSGSEARKAAQQRRAWQKRSGSEPRIPGLIRGRMWQNQEGSGSEARKPGPRGKMYE